MICVLAESKKETSIDSRLELMDCSKKHQNKDGAIVEMSEHGCDKTHNDMLLIIILFVIKYEYWGSLVGLFLLDRGLIVPLYSPLDFFQRLVASIC